MALLVIQHEIWNRIRTLYIITNALWRASYISFPEIQYSLSFLKVVSPIIMVHKNRGVIMESEFV
jgi:hypothetical protein